MALTPYSSYSSYSSFSSGFSSQNSWPSPRHCKENPGDIHLSTDDADAFHCYELMTIRHLNQHPHLLDDLIQNAQMHNGEGNPMTSLISQVQRLCLIRFATSLSQEHWFVLVYMKMKPDRLLLLLSQCQTPVHYGRNFLQTYLQSFHLTKLYLDRVLDRSDESRIPKEIFRDCPHVKVLSLKNNYLRRLPAEVGCLTSLEKLYLTHNRLENWSIPHTLVFCRNLREIYLDNNLLDALPSVLLEMPSLQTVYRHGNHNYFKATFMWYHTDVNGRIMESSGRDIDFDGDDMEANTSPLTLQQLAAKVIISTRINFFALPANSFPTKMKYYVAALSNQVNICGNCASVRSSKLSGYKVFTFKNPYLGNTCVPFLHWACSSACAKSIEIPACEEQRISAFEQDRRYEMYILESVEHVLSPKKRRRRFPFSDQGTARIPKTSSSSLSVLRRRPLDQPGSTCTIL